MLEMKRWNKVLAEKVAGESRRQNLGYDGYKKELKRQVSRLIEEWRYQP